MAEFDVVLYKKLEEDKLAMPSDLNLMRFKNNAIAYLAGSDNLQKYLREYGANGYAHMQIIKGMVQSAHFGLDFLNNEAYLIPYKEKLDFMPSYKGLIKLCMRYATRPIKTIYAIISFCVFLIDVFNKNNLYFNEIISLFLNKFNSIKLFLPKFNF